MPLRNILLIKEEDKETVEEKKSRPLTDREKGYIKYRADGRPTGESSLRAGFSSTQYGSYLNAQEHIQSALKTAIEDVGLTDEFLAKRLKEGADATKLDIKKKGKEVVIKEVPDFGMRHKYIETSMKAKGSLKQEGETTKLQQINIIVTPDVAKGFLDSGVIDKKEHKEFNLDKIFRELNK